MMFKPFFVVLLIVILSVSEGRPTVDDDEIERMVNATIEMAIEENVTYSEYTDYTPPPYQCNNSLASFETFHRCARRTLQGRTSFNESLITMEQIMTYLDDFCKMKPAILSCTLEKAINCSAEVQQGLRQGVQAGLVCEAGGTGNVHPNVQYIFERLGEEGITEFQHQSACRVEEEKVQQCFEQGLKAAGIEQHSSEGERALQALALPDLFDKAGKFLEAMTECTLRSLRNAVSNQTSCDWRVYAIETLQEMYYPPMPGINFPFTRSELDELFQFGNGNNV